MTEIWERLQRIAKEKDISRREVSQRTKKSDSMVSRWFTGENTPGTASLRLLADALGVAVADLNGDVDDHDCAKMLGLGESGVLLLKLYGKLEKLGLGAETVALITQMLAICQRGREKRVSNGNGLTEC